MVWKRIRLYDEHLDLDPHRPQCAAIHFSSRFKKTFSLRLLQNKRTMMVLYRSPEFLTVQVNNEDKYQIDY